MSSRTRSLSLALINVLVFDMITGGILLAFPMFGVILLFMNNSKWTAIYTRAVLTSCCVYPLVANITLLIIVKPYRKATLQLFPKVFKGISVQRNESTEAFSG
ncbi:serpentine type 7TM GPCR chemoreceptor str domain-containing protein [Ditylenchus destructor]|nr:serpentine type 7TM GPCR chemoreceptor str domain-containing protein [Ditylenchus destructor]